MVDYYRANLENSGWTISNVDKEDGKVVIRAKKDEFDGWVTVIHQESGSDIELYLASDVKK